MTKAPLCKFLGYDSNKSTKKNDKKSGPKSINFFQINFGQKFLTEHGRLNYIYIIKLAMDRIILCLKKLMLVSKNRLMSKFQEECPELLEEIILFCASYLKTERNCPKSWSIFSCRLIEN